MEIGINADLLSNDPETIKKNLLSKISHLEAFSLLFLFFAILIFSYHHTKGYYIPWDFERSYLLAGRGDFSNFFYGYWIAPLFWLLEKIPGPVSYIIWSVINVVSTFTAARVLGGKSWTAIFSYQMIYVVFYGQITGLILGALGLTWWGLVNKKPHAAGIGLLLAAAKPQLGFVIGFILWITADLSWNDRLKSLIIPILGVCLTFAAYPQFIQNILSVIQQGKVGYAGNFSLWQYIGPWSLVFFIPPIALKLSRQDRILMLVAASILSVPYLQQTGFLTLFVFPFGWLPILGNLGYLFPFLGWGLIRSLIAIPLVIYTLMLIKGINRAHSAD